jgi:hypothetical protein
MAITFSEKILEALLLYRPSYEVEMLFWAVAIRSRARYTDLSRCSFLNVRLFLRMNRDTVNRQGRLKTTHFVNKCTSAERTKLSAF